MRLNPIHLHDLDLDDAAEKDEARSRHWRQAAAAREKGEAFVRQRTERGILIFSRKSSKPEEKFEYFVLLRNMPPEQAVTSQHIEKVTEATDGSKQPCVGLRLNKEGGDRFHSLTDANKERQLAIVYEGQVFSAPTIKSAIRTEVQITGKFTKQDIEKMITVLKAASKPR
jgi:preprotein translocase subunit SecD